MVGTQATRDVQEQVPGSWTARLARVTDGNGKGTTLVATTVLSTVLLLSAFVADAAVERIEGKAVRTLTTGDGRFGGCMVQLDERHRELGPRLPGQLGDASVAAACTRRGTRVFACSSPRRWRSRSIVRPSWSR